jgi:hypothetical protein
MRFSLYAYYLSCALILATAFLYFPKWKQKDSNATISWDASGYYLYLPATFIYHDLRQLKFMDGINAKYGPDPSNGQSFKQPSGNFVLKYPIGQALQLLPWFLVANTLASPLGYPADGYSPPYQAAISWGSILIALLGLWFFRRILLTYFSDKTVAVTLICFVAGSNYLEYSAITGAMTHNWLFTLYALLIYASMRFYQNPTRWGGVLIGILVGWATITRPTEFMTVLIPLLWGVGSLAGLRERVAFLRRQAVPVLLAALAVAGMISIQLAYWKYAGGHWFIYTYQEQGFSWLHPHIYNVLLSAKAGWWVYSPMLFLAVPGFYFLWRRQPVLFPAVLLICLVCLYITSAWDIWWYGGSLGQRSLVQGYPLWAFAFAALVEQVSGKLWTRIAFGIVAVPAMYISLWWVHQAHHGVYFIPEQINTPYLLKVLGRFNVPTEEAYKLLDAREEFGGGERRNVQEISFSDFERDSTGVTTDGPIHGAKSAVMHKSTEFAGGAQVSFPPAGLKGVPKWVRASAWYRCDNKEWDVWKMTQFIVRFTQEDASGKHVVKERMIRLQRFIDGNEPKSIFFDTQIPDQPFNRINVFFWNAGSDKDVRFDDVRLEVFE